MSATHRGSEAPKTIYPLSFFVEMGTMVFIVGWTCFFVFTFILELDFVWWIIAFLVILACIRPMLTTYIYPFTARLVLDGITKEIRCLRKGLAWISPAETLGKIVDLKTDIKGVENESYTCKVGGILAKFVYSMAPDPYTDEAVITYESWELDAIKQAARAFISMTLSDYFTVKEKDEDILLKAKINRKLFRDPVDENILHSEVLAFAKKHGVIVEEIRLEDVDFDEETQRARDTVSKAASIRKAKHELTDPSGDGTPMEESVAAETVQMLNIPGLRKHIFDVRGVPNVRDVSILGGAGMFSDDDKKKWGKK